MAVNPTGDRLADLEARKHEARNAESLSVTQKLGKKSWSNAKILFATVLLLQVAFINSISGTNFQSNVLILIGLLVQVLLGLAILSFFIESHLYPFSARIAAAFVLGIFPILLLNWWGWGRVSISVIAFVLAAYKWRSGTHAGLSSSENHQHDDKDLTATILAIVVCNIVFLRIHQTVLGIAVLLVSLLLPILPIRLSVTALRTYAGLIAGVFVVQSLRVTESAIFTYFRFFPDWTEEQVFAKALAENSSRMNPLVQGDIFTYHFLTAWYWGSFENLFDVDTFAFSGPALLSVSVLATVLLVVSSGSHLFESRNSRVTWLLLLLASWPFFDSFALDAVSRSQTLSLTLCAMIVFSLSMTSKRVWFGMIPFLTAAVSITKVSTGLFVSALLGSYVLLQLLQYKRGLLEQTSRFTPPRRLVAGLVLTATSTIAALAYVFFLTGTFSSHGQLSFTLTWPEAFATNLVWLIWLQRAIAFVPILILVIFGLSQFHRTVPVIRRSVPLAITGGILLSFSLSLFLQSESGVPFLGYIAGIAAVFSSITISSYMPSLALIRRLGLVYLSAVAIFSFAYLLLERSPVQTWATNRAIVAIPLAFLVLVVFLKPQLKSLSLALLTSTVLLCSGVSLGHVVANRTNGVLSISTAHTEWDDYSAQFQGVIAFLKSYDKSFVYAVDEASENSYREDGRTRLEVYFVLGSTSIQLWAEPHYTKIFMNSSAEVHQRLYRQYLLTTYPSPEHVSGLKSAGVSHLILFNDARRLRWNEYILSKDVTPAGGDDTPTMVYEDRHAAVIKL